MAIPESDLPNGSFRGEETGASRRAGHSGVRNSHSSKNLLGPAPEKLSVRSVSTSQIAIISKLGLVHYYDIWQDHHSNINHLSVFFTMTAVSPQRQPSPNNVRPAQACPPIRDRALRQSWRRTQWWACRRRRRSSCCERARASALLSSGRDRERQNG